MLQQDIESHRMMIIDDLLEFEQVEQQLNLMENYNSELKLFLQNEH